MSKFYYTKEEIDDRNLSFRTKWRHKSFENIQLVATDIESLLIQDHHIHILVHAKLLHIGNNKVSYDSSQPNYIIQGYIMINDKQINWQIPIDSLDFDIVDRHYFTQHYVHRIKQLIASEI